MDNINHKGEIESQPLLEQGLVAQYQLENDLFMTAEQKRQEANRLQLKKFAYVKSQDGSRS